jgi:pre-mRNA-splicing factor CDC5/CEF1
MRIIIKGGAWKNTEDEILKAAVMKYGLNQWSRIASLMNRKSAKQCKARWHEWLDPNIKKMEWTREEDEKLLHLAKLFPVQWRTVAPIVGRTPTQCLERYDRLTSMAEKGEVYENKDDPRRLRPGEIDPNPESKPARPDAVDMDDDEKEMLAEARARLANTRGKKAKRKAREKQMEEAKRLAHLQKTRELKASGIEMAPKWRSKRVINYNNEVAFERKPSIGIYDTFNENERSRTINKRFEPTIVNKIEGDRRKDIESALKKEYKHLVLNEEMKPDKITKSDLSVVLNISKKGKIMLPTPQVSDHDFTSIAKRQFNELIHENNFKKVDFGSATTQKILADYSQISASAISRTPQSLSLDGQDAILSEAKMVKALISAPSSLDKTGTKNSVDLSKSDFSGLVPQRRIAQTPDPAAILATSFNSRNETSTTDYKSTIARENYTPSATPTFYDELGLNESGHIKDDSKLEKVENLQVDFRGLPLPKNSVSVIVPILGVNELQENNFIIEDTFEMEKRDFNQKKVNLRLKTKKQTQANLRLLPLPELTSVKNNEVEEIENTRFCTSHAESMLATELSRILVDYESINTKSNNYKIVVQQNVTPTFSAGELHQASELLSLEVDKLKIVSNQDTITLEEFSNAHENLVSVFLLNQRNGYDQKTSPCDDQNHLISSLTKSSLKKENKFIILIDGLRAKNLVLKANLNRLVDEYQDIYEHLTCLTTLRLQDTRDLSDRFQDIKRLKHEQEERANGLQKKYLFLSKIKENG